MWVIDVLVASLCMYVLINLLLTFTPQLDGTQHIWYMNKLLVESPLNEVSLLTVAPSIVERASNS